MKSWLIRFEQNPLARIIIDFCAATQQWRSEVQMMDVTGEWETMRVGTGERAYRDALHYGVAS